MKLLVATDAHIFKTADGKYWTPKIYGYDFWKRYLGVFDEVRIVARLKEVNTFSDKWLRVDGSCVEVFGIPFYQGPIQLMKKYVKIHRVLKNAFNGCSAAIFRVPGQTAFMTFQHMKKGFPCAGEVVYDPTEDVNDKNNGVILHLLNVRISNQLKNFCKKANGVSYVTQYTIQEHYPCMAKMRGISKRFFETYYSTIILDDDAFTAPRSYKGIKKLTLALSDVAMNTERKGERTLIKAVKYAVDLGYDVNAIIIGDGSKRKEFEAYARELKVKNRIQFTGLLSSPNAVREILLKSDVFVFPTKGEGLPRGILEAMAVGMPVLSSPVGGIPEILEKEYMYNPMDAKGYGKEICKLLDNTELLDNMSKNNFMKAQEFKNSVLQKRRDKFYKKLRNLVE